MMEQLDRFGLYLNQPEPAILCIQCKFALKADGDRVSRHLGERHGISKLARRGPGLFIRALRLPDPKTLPVRPDGSSPHPHLRIQQGAACRHCYHFNAHRAERHDDVQAPAYLVWFYHRWGFSHRRVTIRLLDISSYGLIIARISDSGYHLYFIWEWINVVAAKGQFQSGKEAGLMVKTYLMARIVLTIAASVFLLSSSNDFNLMVRNRPHEHRGIIADILKATATIRGAHSVLYTISLVPAELHRSPEVEVELESHGNKSTSQWHPDKDQGTPDYAFRVPSQETLDTV
ncbi:hypothetical protein FPOA_13953 [Fusarium poae]|uniref:Uncharacterized protein n=1 Tax=Fusarium poae TaxID=36050 RepID=A0A1B8A3W7_FUSPO|nr:hypothetical protein FPOA_13953 [Fusarium poae]